MNPALTMARLPLLFAAAALLASPASAQFSFDPEAGGFSFPDPVGESNTVAANDGPLVTATARFTPAVEGQSAMVEVTAQIAPGYHVYAVDQPKGGPLGVDLTLDPSSGATLAGDWVAVTPPKIKRQPEIWGDMPLMEHYGEVVWRAPIEISAGADPRVVSVTGKVTAQVCSESTCLPPSDSPFTATPAAVGSIIPVPTTEPAADAAASPQNRGQVLASGETEAISKEPLAAANATESLWFYLGGAFLGGLILNLMPCVLPVIGLKVLSFAEQAGHDRGKVLAMNLAYSAGLMAVFMLLACLAAFAGYGWGELNTHASYRIGMVVFVFAMALSFLGVWEIPLPGFAGGRGANDLQQKEGYSGAFFKGAFTTILATPCSGPFLGPVFGFLISQPPAITFLMFAAIGLGMASPYLLIGAFPSLIKVLPKPGMWMETFKQLMGFVLMGTAVYFLFWVVSPGNQKAVAVTLVAVSLACWWIGRMPITAPTSKRMTAWLGGWGMAALVGWAAFGQLATTQAGPQAHDGYEHGLAWVPFSESSLEGAKSDGKTVLVDFTANWCPTCQTNSLFAINTERVKEVVDSNGVVPILADWSNPNEEIKRTLESLGSRSIPFLAIFPADRPNQPILLPDVITESQLLTALAEAGAVEANPEAQGITPTIEIGEAAQAGTFR